jgi:hypothetical protein
MPSINFPQRKDHGSDEPLKPNELGFPVPETYSLPESSKNGPTLTSQGEIAQKRQELAENAMPGPLKELLQKRSDTEQNFLSLGIVLQSAEAIAQIPAAFKKALEKHLP